MNARLKQEWIDALRNGKYEQGKGALAKNEKYCCLGVLCEVAEVPKYLMHGNTQSYGNREIGYSTTVLPCGFGVQQKLSSNPGIQTGEYENTLLIDCNDSGMPFTQIADLIERFIPTED